MTSSKPDRLRRLIEAPEPLVLPYGASAFDAVMAEHSGFKAVGLSGSWATVYLLARADYSLISLAEQAMIARNMSLAVDIPVVADADQGFGNAINTYYAVQSLIGAGVAGVHIEDQPFPKRCGFVGGKELISAGEMVGKLCAARDAAREMESDVVIIARTDALTAAGGGLDEAISRARQYRDDGGAEVIYVEGSRSLEEVERLREAITGPMFCSLNAIDPHPSVEQLRAVGQSVIPLAEIICEPAMVVSWNSLQDFQRLGMDGWNRFRQTHAGHPMAHLRAFDFAGFPRIRQLENRYLSEAELRKYEASDGLYRFDQLDAPHPRIEASEAGELEPPQHA